MKAITRKAEVILAQLVKGLRVGQARTIGGPRGKPIMPVSVERIGEALYSIAHYYEQHGDLMADPDMVFWLHDGRFYPASYQQDGLGIFRRAIEFGEDGQPVRLARLEQRDQAIFASQWMQNIRWQQAEWFDTIAAFEAADPGGHTEAV